MLFTLIFKINSPTRKYKLANMKNLPEENADSKIEAHCVIYPGHQIYREHHTGYPSSLP